MDADTITKLVTKTTGKWAKQRKAEERRDASVMRRYEAMTSRRRVTVKDAAWDVMESAYMKASAGNTLPAAARQIMYAARGAIQRKTSRPLDDQYFCQTLLPDYMNAHPSATAEWDVVFDARGNFTEPFSDGPVPLGTLQVRNYLDGVRHHFISTLPDINLRSNYPTKGPENRFGAILFLEKEGFGPLLQKVKLAERYDLAIMSTKGLSVTAARQLVDELCARYGVPLLIVRDFDKAGFSIAGTLQKDTRRYVFRNDFRVIDLGLRLGDVEEWGLESEDVVYGDSSPEWNLRENGATKDEIGFLYDGRTYGKHSGRRVELNAFPSDALVEWLESKLEAHGIEKVVPDDDVLGKAYRRAVKVARIQQAIDEITGEEDQDVEIPDDLAERIRGKFEHEDRAMSWDAAVAEIAAEDREENDYAYRP